MPQPATFLEVGPLKQTYYISLCKEDLDQFGSDFEEYYGGLSIVMQHAAYASQCGDLYGTYTGDDAWEAGEEEFAMYLKMDYPEGIRWKCTPSPMEVDRN